MLVKNMTYEIWEKKAGGEKDEIPGGYTEKHKF